MTITVRVLKATNTNPNGYMLHIKHSDLGAHNAAHFLLNDAAHHLKYDVYGSGFQYAADFPVGGSIKHFLVKDHGTARVDVSFSPAVKVSVLTDPSSFENYFQNASYNFIGNGGNDTFDSASGADRLQGCGGNDRLTGWDGDDVIDGGIGNDTLRGLQGRDVLIGGLGRDLLYGGEGGDRFDFNSLQESRPGASRDVLYNFFRSQGDRIDLSTIDVDTTAVGNQAFDFVGAASFSGVAGELRFASGLLQADVNGDAIADFQLSVVGIASMMDRDFIL